MYMWFVLQSEKELRYEKHPWLLHHILYSELEELLRESESDRDDNPDGQHDKQVKKFIPPLRKRRAYCFYTRQYVSLLQLEQPINGEYLTP